MKTKRVLVGLLFAAICVSICLNADALWNPTWEVTFSDSLDLGDTVLKDSYALGAGGNGSDSYGISEDILKVYPPGWPDGTYSGLAQEYVGMESTVGGAKLAKDARATVGTVTTWDIDKVSNAAISGTETITWDASDTNIPGALPLTLIDYGTDSSRTTEVASVDMKAQSTYVVAVSGGSGVYRYMSVIAGTVSVEAPVVSISISGNDVVLKWDSDSGVTYDVYYTDDLASSWVLGQAGIAGTGSEIQWTDTGAAAQGKRFYKVEVY